jgi:hypothetical protein
LPDAWWRLSLRTRRLIAAGVAVGVVALVAGLVSLITGGDDGEPAPVVFVASLSPARVATWDDLAGCESEGRWDLDTGNGYFGGIQFGLVSWQEVGGAGSPAAASREEQIMRGEFLYDLQGWGAWPRCSAQLGLE